MDAAELAKVLPDAKEPNGGPREWSTLGFGARFDRAKLSNEIIRPLPQSVSNSLMQLVRA
jgi:hypothetical protein